VSTSEACDVQGPAASADARAPRPAAASAASATLLREQLADGPKPGTAIEAAAQAAEIPKRALIAATDALDVRCRQWPWWLPGEDRPCYPWRYPGSF
jgi:hypothetical protein